MLRMMSAKVSFSNKCTISLGRTQSKVSIAPSRYHSASKTMDHWTKMSLLHARGDAKQKYYKFDLHEKPNYCVQTDHKTIRLNEENWLDLMSYRHVYYDPTGKFIKNIEMKSK